MEEISSDDSLEVCVRRFADGLMALAQAPLMKDNYKGPVLFTNGGATEFYYNNFLNSPFYPHQIGAVTTLCFNYFKTT